MIPSEIPIVGSIDDPDLMSKIEEALRDPDCDMRRDREYSGQPQTSGGIRGKTLVEGLTMRDVRDCFIRAVCLSAGDTNMSLYTEALRGENAKLNCDSLYEIDLSKLDPMAIAQNLACEIERAMGIFPNVKPLKWL